MECILGDNSQLGSVRELGYVFISSHSMYLSLERFSCFCILGLLDFSLILYWKEFNLL